MTVCSGFVFTSRHLSCSYQHFRITAFAYVHHDRPSIRVTFYPLPTSSTFSTVLNTKVRQKFTSTFALFRGNIQFQFLQSPNVNRRTAVGKLLLLSRSIMLDVVSKLPAERLRCLTGLRFFFSLKRPDRLWGSIQLAIQWIPGVLSSGAKLPGSLQLITRLHLVPRLRMKGIYTPTHSICFNFVDRNNFEFPFVLRLMRRVNLHVFCNILINSVVFKAIFITVSKHNIYNQ